MKLFKRSIQRSKVVISDIFDLGTFVRRVYVLRKSWMLLPLQRGKRACGRVSLTKVLAGTKSSSYIYFFNESLKQFRMGSPKATGTVQQEEVTGMLN